MNLKRLISTLSFCLMLVAVIIVTLSGGQPRPTWATPQACTPGPHDGTLAANETWCAGTPHIIGMVLVPAGITLTLEPGTVVKGNGSLSDLRILPGGHLEAVGTPTQPITLTSVTDSGPDQWNGLNFRGGTGNLDYVTVRYGGSSSSYSGMTGNVSLFDVQGVVRIQHSRILDVGNLAGNSVHGLNVTNSHLELSDTFFSGNATQSGVGVEPNGYPMGIFGPSSVVTMTGNTFTGNLHDRVLLGDWGGYAMTGNAQATLYRQSALEGYEFGTNYTIPAGMTLNVEPGVTLMSRWGQGIQVLGRLEAIGTATQPITITSATNTGPDQWSGLYFNGGTGELDHVTVRYGGSGGSWWGNVILRNVQAGVVRIQHSRILDVGNIAGNTVHGLDVGNSRLELTDTLFSGNATQSGVSNNEGYPMSISGPNSVVTMTGNIFTGNLNDRVLIDGSDAMMANAQATLYRQATLEGYEFRTNYNIPVGITLNVEPGVTLMSRWGQGIQVLGRLEAIGTASQPITITSATNTGPDQWSGLYFNGGTGELDHVTVRYGGSGGSWWGNVILRNVQNGVVRIQHSRILDVGNIAGNTVHGLDVGNSRIELTDTLFSGNAIESGVSDNEGYPMAILGASSVVTMTGNIFTGNLNDRVLLDPDAMTANAQVTLYRQAALEGYELRSGYQIPAGMTLTVESGVTLMGRWGPSFKVLGRLEAIGTATQPITFTSATNTGPGQWSALYFNGGTGNLDYVTVRYGGATNPWDGNRSVNVILQNVSGAGVHISNSLITQADSPGSSPSGVLVENSIAVITNTVLADIGSESTAAGVRILGADSQVQLTNVAVVRTSLPGSGGKAIRVEGGANLVAVHTTIAGDQGDGISVNGATAIFTNTILSQNSIGVRVGNSGLVTMTQTLWDNNATPAIGAVSATGNITGPAVFAADGYHLTRYSFAIDQGLDAGVTDDIDGQPRPMPVGAAPDLGADEYPYSPGQEFVAEKAALPPQMLPPDSSSGNPYWRLRQPYLIRYYYGSPDPNPSDLALAITDTLPAGLALESQTAYPPLSFQQQGNTLKWNLPALHSRQSGTIQLMGVYTMPQAGRVFTNQAELQAGTFHFDLLATSSVPLIAPLITSPGNGELCAGSVNIKGTAQPGVTVTVYVNGSSYASPQPDASGLFTATYSYAGNSNVTIKARACLNDDQCSADSNTITLTAPQSFWCPQHSSWEGTPAVGPLAGKHLTYQFRNNTGNFSTQNWIVPGVYGFWNTTLHLRACNCPGGAPPSSVWVFADGVRYDPTGSYPQYDFAITGGAHNVVFWAQCGTNQISSVGLILIDPDGYVFDVTKGFAVPTNTVQGITVTAYVSMPQWGGWVPWPAQLYNNQVNPQVTGSEGYFAFFTPPGSYYLQAEGAHGYQAWRSPVIEVITQVVHMNVPLTPWLAGNYPQVTLTSGGLSPAVITVSVGSAVQWVSELNSLTSPAELVSLIENPVLRLLSARNPLSDTLGFDGGMLSPGQAYRRQFTRPGTYTYSDGVGHTAQVVVTNYRIYLPLVLKK